MSRQLLRVLVLDDDEDDAVLIADSFDDVAQTRYDVAIETNVEPALARLGAEPFDAFLCDYRLGAVSGVDVMRRVRDAGIDVPMVLLTGVSDAEIDRRAMEAGASDFVAKDEATPQLLDRSVRYAMAAAERQRLLRAVLDSASAAVLLVGGGGRVELHNAMALEIACDAGVAEGADSLPALVDAALGGTGEVCIGERVLDCNVTPFDGGRRLIVLHDVTERARALAERERAERSLAYAARHDALTGLYNRTAFADAFDHWLKRCVAGEHAFAILSFDLDRFKEVNDVHGHAVGDELLIGVAKRLRRVLADQDEHVLARLGGDEFIALVPAPDGTAEGPMKTAQAILQDFAEPHAIAGHTIHAETSIGIAIAPAHGLDGETLLANADLAMYRAKKMPLRAFCVFEESMDAAVRADREIAEDLRRAIKTGEIGIYAQPQATLRERRLTGFEALARWTRPNGESVPPDRFITVAERSGLILPLGEHLLRRAIAEAAEWRNQAKVAINVSPVQVNHSNLPDVLHAAMVEYGLSPTRIEIEITETALLEHTNRALHALRKIRSLGITVALDDFGTGYSSLAMLRSFPFDKIKIDRSFVKGLSGRDGHAIVRSIAQLGENLGTKVLCEGVETEEDAAILEALGCEEMQGYLLSRPMPAREASDWQPVPAVGPWTSGRRAGG